MHTVIKRVTITLVVRKDAWTMVVSFCVLCVCRVSNRVSLCGSQDVLVRSSRSYICQIELDGFMELFLSVSRMTILDRV